MKLFKYICLAFFIVLCTNLTACNQYDDWKLSIKDQYYQEFSYIGQDHLFKRPLVITVRGNNDIIITRKAEIQTMEHKKTFDIDCDGDGIFEKRHRSELTKCQSHYGIRHHIAIRGDVTTLSISSLNQNDHTISDYSDDEIISLDQWGDFAWTDLDIFSDSFKNGSIIFKPNDAPNLSSVKSLEHWARPYKCFQTSIENWDVSNVTDMSNAFHIYPPQKHDGIFSKDLKDDECLPFNPPIGKWNVSKVTNMSHMFENATAFNQPLGNWNVTNVTNMSSMFKGASAFNQPIQTWETTSLNSALNMFENASAFNQKLPDALSKLITDTASNTP